jgi:Cu-processing system permease protein
VSVTGLVLRAGVRDLSRSRWVAAYAAGFFLIAEGLFWFGGTGPQVVLSLLNVVLLVVPLVSLVFGAMHVYASREFVELLLAQPVPRRALFAGLYLGLALPLAVAVAAGVGVPFALNARALSGAAALGTLLAAAVGLTLVYTAVATWLALSTDDRLRGVGLALGVWFLTTLVYDGVVLAITASLGDWPIERPLLALMLANPVDVARVLVLTRLDVSALMGYTGALFRHTFGSAVGVSVAAAALLCWLLAPLALATRRFDRRDF